MRRRCRRKTKTDSGMFLIEDTRNKIGKHDLKHKVWSKDGDKVHRCALPVGDYALFPRVSIDTKESMLEIAQNIGGSSAEHERFRRELQLAQEYGCKLYVLIENDEGIRELNQVQYWGNPRLRYSTRAIKGPQLMKAMLSMEARYGVKFMFCTPSESPGVIRELLRKEKANV